MPAIEKSFLREMTARYSSTITAFSWKKILKRIQQTPMLENSKLTPPKNKSFQVHLLQEEVSALIKSYKKQFDIFLLEAIKG